MRTPIFGSDPGRAVQKTSLPTDCNYIYFPVGLELLETSLLEFISILSKVQVVITEFGRGFE